MKKNKLIVCNIKGKVTSLMDTVAVSIRYISTKEVNL